MNRITHVAFGESRSCGDSENPCVKFAPPYRSAYLNRECKLAWMRLGSPVRTPENESEGKHVFRDT
jgi:hypothetical protein